MVHYHSKAIETLANPNFLWRVGCIKCVVCDGEELATSVLKAGAELVNGKKNTGFIVVVG